LSSLLCVVEELSSPLLGELFDDERVHEMLSSFRVSGDGHAAPTVLTSGQLRACIRALAGGASVKVSWATTAGKVSELMLATLGRRGSQGRRSGVAADAS
jgi:hypothetical protein